MVKKTEVIAVLCFLFLHLPVAFYHLGFRDEGFFSYNALRIANGEVPYGDFFLTTTPGSYYILALFFKLFGQLIVFGKILYTITAALLIIVFMRTFAFHNRLVSVVALFVLIYVLGAPMGTVASYDTYGVFFLLLTGFTYLQAKKHNNVSLYFLLGCLVVITFSMKQSIGALTIVGFLLLIILNTTEKLRNMKWYLGAVVISLATFFGYFYVQHALSQTIYHIFFFASEVKAHAQAFVIHRVLFLGAFACFVLLFRYASKQWRWIMSFVGVLLLSLYIFSSPDRIGRLWTYFFDPVFYLMSMSYGCSLGILFLLFVSRKKIPQKDVYILSASLLLIITIAIGGSGFAKSFGSITAPLYIPVIVYFFEVLSLFVPSYKNSIRFFAIPALFIYIIYLFPYFPFEKKYNENLVMLSKQHGMPSARFILVEKDQAEELTKLTAYIQKHTKHHEPIFCFPYCPMLYMISERCSPSYYSFFYPEVFPQSAQKNVIVEIETNKMRYVIMQKKGAIEPEADFENKRLSLLYRYLIIRYKVVFETQQFTVLRKQ